MVIDAQVTSLAQGENLSSIAPTVLQLMGIAQPAVMTGRSVIKDSLAI
jgi:bisphosphoglycerate-independent phosphoglycerate mutase (AlkP superfamily)